MTDKQLLMKVEGIAGTRAAALLNHFGSGHKVAQSACSNWNEITKVRGFSDDEARELFHKMKDAGVYDDLRRY